MEYLLVITGLLFSIGFAYWLHNAFDQQIEKIAATYYSALASQYPDLFGQGYRFYTDNHPYVWGEVPEEDFIALVKAAATGAKGVPLDPPICCYSINTKTQCFYFIPGKDSFDFSRRMHYQEWLDSQADIARNIAHYKNSH